MNCPADIDIFACQSYNIMETPRIKLILLQAKGRLYNGNNKTV